MSSSINNQTMVEEHQSLDIDAVTPAATISTGAIRSIRWPFLLLNCALMALGTIGFPLLTRLYYIHGGSSRWIQTSSQNVGFLIFSVPLIILYIRGLKQGVSSSNFFIETKLFFSSALIGLILGLVSFMYSVGLSYIPVSTSSILASTQLAFTALFARLLVKQKFTSYSVNSVVVMTLGSVTLVTHANGDRPDGVSKGQYILGLFMTLGSAALLGLMLPAMELSLSKARKIINYVSVLQFMFNIGLFGTLFSTIGMLISKDFQEITREARAYELGNGMYYFVLAATAISSQIQSVGLLGVLYCTSSLFSGIYSTILLPFIQIASVIFYHEKFTGEKGIALALFLWGFTFYFYGEYRNKIDEKVKLHAQVHESEGNPSLTTAL